VTTTLDFANPFGSQPYPLTIDVYFKDLWQDEWKLQSDVGVDRVVWSSSPRIGIAQLYWRYGFGKQPSDSWLQQISRKSIQRWHVKLDVQTTSLTIPGTTTSKLWYGQIEIHQDIIDGEVQVESGRQAFIAYSMESTLFKYPILHSLIANNARWYDAGLEFNRDGKGNRTDINANVGFPTFSVAATAPYWSSRDIVRYIAGTNSVDLDPTGITYLPTWDRPTVSIHGRKPGQILNAVMARQRLLGWRVDVVEGSSIDRIKIVPFTFAESSIVLSGGNEMKKNPSTYHLNLHNAADAIVDVRFDKSGTYNQVVVEGANRRSVFTVSDSDNTLAGGWTSDQKANYDTGASGDASYPAAPQVDERRRRNIDARATDDLLDVYSRFQLPFLWDFKSADGQGGTKYPAFLEQKDQNVADDFGDGIDLYWPTISIEPTIPLLANVDYASGFTAPASGDKATELAPICLIELPEDSGRFVTIENAGMASDLPTTDTTTNKRWSASLAVSSREREPAFYIRVKGQPQHTIASADFVPLPEDRDLGSFNWRDMVTTISIREDRRCMAKWPPDAIAFNRFDLRRRLLIDAGKSYRLDYMPAGTVLGIDPQTGGLVKAPNHTWVNDDRDKLRDIAEVAYQWYGKERRSLKLKTKRIIMELGVGDLIVSVSRTSAVDVAVGTIVTEVAIDNPLSGSEQPRNATMSITTAFAQLDPLKL